MASKLMSVSFLPWPIAMPSNFKMQVLHKRMLLYRHWVCHVCMLLRSLLVMVTFLQGCNVHQTGISI